MNAMPVAVSPGPNQSSHSDLVTFLGWVTSRHARAGGVTEVRLLADRPRSVHSAFTDPVGVAAVIDAIRPPDRPRPKVPYGEHPRIGEANVYYTMNPAAPALLARSARSFNRCQATADADVVAYGLVPIDIDPVRTSGVSATDLEKAGAKEVADAVDGWLRERGVSPVWVDSGNGYHLLVATIPYEDVPRAANRAQLFLKMLDKEFSTAAAKVDTTVYNPARILKLPGTLAIKGSHVPDRPHRTARLLGKKFPPDVDLFALLEDDLRAFEAVTSRGPAGTPAAKAGGATAGRPGANFAGGDGWKFGKSVDVLRGVLERSGLPYKEVPKDDTHGRIFAFEECPHHTDHDGHSFECSVMVRPDGSFAAKCFHDPGAGWKEFKPLLGWDQAAGKAVAGSRPETPRYAATPDGLVWNKPTKEGVVGVALTNFGARIVSETVVDDGESERRTFEVEVTRANRKVRVRVPAAEFADMNWAREAAGATAVVYAGHGVRDHARAAVQILSGDVPERRVFSHTGWREVGGRAVYLHALGAIGDRGPVADVAVDLPPALSRFEFPRYHPGTDLVEALRVCLEMLNVAPPDVTFPLFAAAFRAPLGAADFTVALSGPSGTGKTELAALAQQFYGPRMNSRHLPSGWSSTANALEALAFHAKDALLVVDDFAPAGGPHEVAKLHRDADRLLRGQGNGSGRERMRADATLRPGKRPRGLILMTGEDVPRGQSLRARMLALELGPGDVDWRALTACQRAAADGQYALTMAAFLAWLAGDGHGLIGGRERDVGRLRARAAAANHRRTPEIVANLYYGFDAFCRFAVTAGGISNARSEKLRSSAWSALGDAAGAQRVLQASGEPVARYLDLLNAAIASGKAHVAGPDGGVPPQSAAWGWKEEDGKCAARGELIGWVDGPDLYLEPDAAFNAAQSVGIRGGEPLAIGQSTLQKRLKQKHKLASHDAARSRLTVRKTLGGRLRQVLHLRAEVLLPGPEGCARDEVDLD